MNHNQLILNHLQKHKTITTLEAFELYGITRLSARIYDLRESGIKIGLIWETGTNRYGNQVKWGKYYLEKIAK